MDKFVIKGAKRNVENVSVGTHTNKNSVSIISEGECWIFGLPHHSLEDVQAKGNTHKLLRSSKCGKNISGENFRFITFESAFHFWINIGYICERTFSVMSRIKSHFHTRLTDCNLQSQLHCALLLLSSQISQKVSAPNSIRCFIDNE